MFNVTNNSFQELAMCVTFNKQIVKLSLLVSENFIKIFFLKKVSNAYNPIFAHGLPSIVIAAEL